MSATVFKHLRFGMTAAPARLPFPSIDHQRAWVRREAIPSNFIHYCYFQLPLPCSGSGGQHRADGSEIIPFSCGALFQNERNSVATKPGPLKHNE